MNVPDSKSGVPATVPWVRIPPSPPPSLALQRLRARTWEQSEKTPRFRGVLAVKPWPTRTGDGGFRAQKALRPAFISVAKLGEIASPRRANRARTPNRKRMTNSYSPRVSSETGTAFNGARGRALESAVLAVMEARFTGSRAYPHIFATKKTGGPKQGGLPDSTGGSVICLSSYFAHPDLVAEN